MSPEADLTQEQRAARTCGRLSSIGDIPTLPAVLIQVWELTSREDSSAADLGRAIESDPGLTGALLRLANSAYFGFPRKVATVTQAVVVLGLDTVRSLATGASVFRALGSKTGEVDPQAFFHHSLVTAFASRVVMERRSPQRAGTTFCGGILHDLGKLVIAEFLQEALPQIRVRITAGATPEEAETTVLGLNHAGIGEWFAGAWNFPDELTAAVAWHHDPAEAPKESEYAAAVHLGDVLAHRAGAGGSGRSTPPEVQTFALERMAMQADVFDDILEVVQATAQSAGSVTAMLGG